MEKPTEAPSGADKLLRIAIEHRNFRRASGRKSAEITRDAALFTAYLLRREISWNEYVRTLIDYRHIPKVRGTSEYTFFARAVKYLLEHDMIEVLVKK